MTSTDKTGEQLVATIRRTRQGAAGKEAAKTTAAPAQPGPAPAKAQPAPAAAKAPAPADVAYLARPRVWPD
jgi:hypothetical protein